MSSQIPERHSEEFVRGASAALGLLVERVGGDYGASLARDIEEALCLDLAPDEELAAALYEAERDHGVDSDEALAAINDVVARLQLPLDETEQGLTRAASDRVEEFMHRYHPDYNRRYKVERDTKADTGQGGGGEERQQNADQAPEQQNDVNADQGTTQGPEPGTEGQPPEPGEQARRDDTPADRED